MRLWIRRHSVAIMDLPHKQYVLLVLLFMEYLSSLVSGTAWEHISCEYLHGGWNIASYSTPTTSPRLCSLLRAAPSVSVCVCVCGELNKGSPCCMLYRAVLYCGVLSVSVQSVANGDSFFRSSHTT